MRVTFFQLAILTLLVGNTLAKDGKAQGVLKTRISINESSVELKTVLSSLEQKYDFHFVYSPQLIDGLKKINVFTYQRPLSEILDQILTPLKLKYEASDDVIVISKVSSASESAASKEIAQITITGKVVDEKKGEPLPGVTVKIKNSTTAVTTNTEGIYTINVPNAETVLVFSFIGYEPQEKSVGTARILNIVMTEQTNSLNEVVVVGYGTQKAADVTGSVSHVNLESFRNAPNASFSQMLQGTTPGLNIGEVNSAGADASIQVRGQSTINGSQAVLIILDGIPYTGALANINPTDIASVDVLKDASSKAIYGASAANGVMLITTKKGKKGEKPVINFTSSYASQNPAKMLHPLSSSEFLQKDINIYYKTAYNAPDYLTPNPSFVLRTIVDPTQQTGYDAGTDYNWYAQGTNAGYLADNNLSVSNATDKSSYYFGGGYTKQIGYLANDQFARKSVRLNLESKVFPGLTLGAQLFGAFSDYSGVSPDSRTLQLYSPLNVPYDASGNFILTPNASLSNPYLVNVINDYDHRNTLTGNFYAIVSIPHVEGLNYRINYGNDYYWTQQYNFNPYGASSTGSASKYNVYNYDYTVDNILTYRKALNKDNLFDMTLVYGSRKTQNQSTTSNGNGFASPALGYNSIQQATIQTNSSNAASSQFEYQLARLNYGLKEKYLLTASVRRDGFSGFAVNNKYGIFPSTSLAWVINKESFFKVNAIDNLKLRLGYGSNGNLTNAYSSLATVSQGPAYEFGNAGSTLFGQQPTSLENSNLKWESTTGINAGIDFSILKYRISGSIDAYKSVTNNLLYSVPLPTLSGFSAITSNVGKVENKGLEITLNGQIIDNADFKWAATLNFSTNTNKVAQLYGNADVVSTGSGGLYVGHPLGTIFDYKTNGLWQIGETPPAGFYVGGEKLVDANGDGVINANDRVFIGNTLPAYRFSLLNTFNYKQFSLSVFINSIQGGNNSYLGLNDPWDSGLVGTGNAVRNNLFREVNYWTPSNPNAPYRGAGITSAAVYPDPYKNRSFVRLQDVSLSYSLPHSFLNKIDVKNLQFFISGKNLFTITKWQGWDPETGQGLVYGGRPVIRAVSLGLNLTI